jgi:hypothetical protein
MRKWLKWSLMSAVALAATATVGVALRAAHRAAANPANQNEEQRTAGTPTASAQSPAALVILNPDEQAREGIRVEPVKATSMRAELQGTAVILGVTDLATARNNYIAAARTRLQRDRANVAVLGSQYQRVKKLYEQDQNMSLKAMQDAESAFRNAQAQLSTDQQDARLQLDVVRQHWGSVVTGWIESSAPELDAVLNQREFLAQFTFSPGDAARPPSALSLALPGNTYARATFVSALPQVNPQIQSVTYLYRVPARPGLAVGMNLSAMVPVGRLLHGSVVPEDAVVWWQGAAWAYQQTAANQFSRRAVPTNLPVAGGYFVPATAIEPGTKLVTAGASTLLSQELLVHSQGEEGGGDDDD